MTAVIILPETAGGGFDAHEAGRVAVDFSVCDLPSAVIEAVFVPLGTCAGFPACAAGVAELGLAETAMRS